MRSLLRHLDVYRYDVLRFTSDFWVPFSTNEVERGIQVVKLQPAEGLRLRAVQDAFAGEPRLPATS